MWACTHARVDLNQVKDNTKLLGEFAYHYSASRQPDRDALMATTKAIPVQPSFQLHKKGPYCCKTLWR
jgi:hypothetical protein